jgi:DNA-binding NarL/FixJ family response regulator
MLRRSEAEFAEVMVGRLLLEAFANERSAYHQSAEELDSKTSLDRYRGKLKYHIRNSLSPRQKQVITQYLRGKKEREIAQVLGITQQVVNIYKHRAIKRLHQLLAP